MSELGSYGGASENVTICAENAGKEEQVEIMAQQILKSATSIRHSQSDERLKQTSRTPLSPRFSLTGKVNY